MQKNQYLQILRHNYGLVILVTILFIASAFFLTALRPLNYSATTEIMIIQKQLTETDSYLATKSAERIATNLSQVLYSSSFFDKVKNSGYVDLSAFNEMDEKTKREAWEEMVSAQVIPETGIMQITAYDPKKEQAATLAGAVAKVLEEQGSEYHGGGENIQIKEINTPLTSDFPVKPNLLINLLLGMVFGLLSSSVYLYLFPYGIKIVRHTQQEIKLTPAPAVQNLAQPVLEKTVAIPAKETAPELKTESFEDSKEISTSEQLNSLPVQEMKAVPSVSYAVLDHEHFPKYSVNYKNAPKVSTLFDHVK